MLMTLRLSLSRIVQLISLSITVMLSLLGMWQVQRFRQQVRTANERVPSCLQSADVLEMFVRANRYRAAESLIFYLPTSFELTHLMKQPNASHEVALEMQRSLHASLDPWLSPDHVLLDSLLHAHLMREGLPLSYELQRVDFPNNRVPFRVVHTQRWMPWKSQDFSPTADDLSDTLFVSDDYTQAYVLRGLQIGANDYLRKPFSMRELVARIQSLLRQFPPQCAETEDKDAVREATDGSEMEKDGNILRRGVSIAVDALQTSGEESETSSKVYRCGLTMLYPSRCLLQAAEGRELPLTQREAEILRRLFAQPNEIVERHQLLLDLWGSDTPYNARSLHVFISHLRTKLATDAQLSLRNVHGVGYRLVVGEGEAASS